MLRLVTIPISHYCEKARWALERAEIPYREERHVQCVHVLYAKRAGGGLTVPVLVTPDGVLGESEDILHWVDARTPPEFRLFPEDPAQLAEVETISRRLDAELGPKGRRLIYVHMLQDKRLLLDVNNTGVPRWEDRFLRTGFGLVLPIVRRRLAITPGVEVSDEQDVFRELDWVAELLSDGRPYLSGERFGAADLTFGALSAAVVAPPDYGTPLPSLEQMRPATRDYIARAREHRAGQFALLLVERHRRETISAATASGRSSAGR
ncbi:MAG: glutathione S-transferase [Actinobacteria bacterium]|nr:MAG: glutathione S-transferase [Actinomycetota bacterium]